MSEAVFEVGRVVISKAGRDKNGVYLVIDIIDDKYVLVANGADRSVHRPKKKSIRHLKPQPYILTELQEKLKNGQKVFDSEIRKSLKSLGYELRGG